MKAVASNRWVSPKRRIWMGRLLCLGIVVLYLISESGWHEANRLVPHLLTPLGIILAAIGALGRLWCSSYVAGNKDSMLVKAGPYSLTRNPLYGFSFIGGLGIAITTETLFIPVLFVAWFAYYYDRVITGEEDRLQEIYGDEFKVYQVMVPRFIPRLSGYLEPPRWEISPRAVRRSLFEVLWFVVAAVLLHGLHDLRLEAQWPYLITLF